MPNAPNGCKRRSVGLDGRVGGQAGADTGQEQGLSGSRDTILRLVRRFPQPAQAEPRIIGLDDWAHKRRLRYGTLICDLERSQPIDLLPFNQSTMKTSRDAQHAMHLYEMVVCILSADYCFCRLDLALRS